MAGSFISTLPSLFSVTDEQAMWRVKMQDDPQAFAQLVRRWERPIQSLCARMTGDFHRGEDLAQEAFARIFAKRKTYEASGKFSTFLWRVALNLCHDEIRKVTRRRESARPDSTEEDFDARQLADEGPPPDLRLVNNEREESVRRALLKLTEEQREVVVLRHYEGLKFREIGEVLGVPQGTVKSRMAEALTQLSRILSKSLNKSETVCKPSTITAAPVAT